MVITLKGAYLPIKIAISGGFFVLKKIKGKDLAKNVIKAIIAIDISILVKLILRCHRPFKNY
jgi:hypothetical protein